MRFNPFILIFFSLFIILNWLTALCIYSLEFNTLIQFILLQFLNVSVAYSLTEIILAVLIEECEVPKLEICYGYPAVALLYVTFNDVCANSLKNLKNQSYQNFDIFLLDDSTIKSHKMLIDSSGFKVVRRNTRKGFKAGAINNWLAIYGNEYKYFIIADSDSIFHKDFIESMLKYAEHPLNQKIAIFQSFIINWNNENNFTRIQSTIQPLFKYIAFKIYNRFSYINSWGHNNLHRTNIIMNIGGFDEDFTAEDLAIGIKLIKHGYFSALVDIESFEMIPENIKVYTKRQSKWARQNYQLIKYYLDDIPFITKLHIFMLAYNYIVVFISLIGILITIFYCNTPFNRNVELIYNSNLFDSSILPKMLWIFYVFNYIILRYLLAKSCGISSKGYFLYFILMNSIFYFSSFYVAKELFRAIIKLEVNFEVTDKKKTTFSMLRDFGMPNLFTILILIGILYNPISLILNFLWIFPIILSPIMILLTRK
jgi:hypothetical protein